MKKMNKIKAVAEAKDALMNDGGDVCCCRSTK